MAPTAKPKRPAETWKRTGKCLQGKCQCEAFLRSKTQDGFEICVCAHTQHIHAKSATKDEVG